MYLPVYHPGYTDHGTLPATGTRRTTGCAGYAALTRGVTELTVSVGPLTVGLSLTRFTVGQEERVLLRKEALP